MGRLILNKYGKWVYLPSHSGTESENVIEKILKETGKTYMAQFSFDENGLRRLKFDFAVFNDAGAPALLIEFDGPDHYSKDFYINTGVRPERAKPHVVKRSMGDAEKDLVALRHGCVVLHINATNMENVRDLIISYIWMIVDKEEKETREVSMHKMMERYGWDFVYTIPSKLGRKEQEYLETVGLLGGASCS